jgi:hypothetical protein
MVLGHEVKTIQANPAASFGFQHVTFGERGLLRIYLNDLIAAVSFDPPIRNDTAYG